MQLRRVCRELPAVDSLLMEAVYGDDVMGVYAKRYLTDIADLIDPSGFDSAASTEMGD